MADTETETLTAELRELVGDEPVLIRDVARALSAGDAVSARILDALGDIVVRRHRSTEDAEAGDPAEELWGPDPGCEDVAHARCLGDRVATTALDDALANTVTREEAADILGITPQAVSKRLENQRLTALRRGRRWRLPAWQFHQGEALPGLRHVITSYPGTSLALTVWATSPNSDLEGRTPAETMLRDSDRVVALSQALSELAW